MGRRRHRFLISGPRLKANLGERFKKQLIFQAVFDTIAKSNQ